MKAISIEEFDAEQFAWECFCEAHPHEAAETNFQRFSQYVRTKNPNLTDSEIRIILTETGN